MKLPQEFLDKMNSLLGENEYNEFLNSYEKPRFYGLRVNTLKIDVEQFKRISDFDLKSIPWTKDGFYYFRDNSPGKHPHYYAGLYYIQEPSAMLPAVVLDAKPGEKILDLCAAPGGKTVQLGAGMKGKGILVANDISSNRVKALVKNIELCGIKNAVVTNETPKKLAENFINYFDKILVDAPCSGEGMFRKDEEAARSWQNFKCEKCCGMQWEILQDIDKMLKPGGCIVYSTCTFSPEEDEIMISRFIELYNNYEIMDIPKVAGIANGRPEWANGNTDLSKTARLWPHKMEGEGHFVALLRKKDTETVKIDLVRNVDANNIKKKSFKSNKKEINSLSEDELIKEFHNFVSKNLNIKIEGNFIIKGGNLYWLPESIPNLNGLKIVKFGWYLGSFERGKFEPSHSLAVSLLKEEIKNVMDFSSDSQEIIRYLKGETLMIEGEKALTAICVDGYTIGWAKQMGSMLKNMYPKGWRKLN